MLKIFKRDFNAVIEGTYRFNDLGHLKIARMDIKWNSTSLDDNQRLYDLYGVFSKNLELILSNNSKESVQTIPNVSYYKGLLLNHSHRLEHSVIEIPRVICLKDGRIYLERAFFQQHMQNSLYSHVRPVIKASSKMFKDEKIKRYFKETI